ncbi:MAG: hypothetical protein CVU95_00860 [Firmicutes bacterium HGW-Firmicutes-2]|jgi:hypothetical protein|nr:MAG: hypothetical protein CVU95_00860 [Firmicutes bacterium HGW-Firmicutes-2]
MNVCDECGEIFYTKGDVCKECVKDMKKKLNEKINLTKMELSKDEKIKCMGCGKLVDKNSVFEHKSDSRKDLCFDCY